jgi:hypothetical protein
VGGEDWGLACNAVHFMELFRFLRPSEKLEFKKAELRARPQGSKRGGGFEEFTGSLVFENEGGDRLELVSKEGGTGPGGIRVRARDSKGGLLADIDEGSGRVALDGGDALELEIQYVSKTTGLFLEKLRDDPGGEWLPLASGALVSHRALLAALEAATGRREFKIT